MATIEKRKDSNGNIRFRVKIRLRGAPAVSETFERLPDAKRWVQKTESAIREGRHFGWMQANKYSFEDAVKRYFEEILSREPERRAIEKRRHIQWWLKELGPFLLRDVTPDVIHSARTRLRCSCSDSTCNRYLTSLSKFFSHLVNEWQWLDNNPARRLRKYTEPRGRVRYLSAEERDNLLEACKATRRELYPIVTTALCTGARLGEILNLKWQDVDFAREKLIFQRTKNGDRRSAPLKSHALQAMQAWAKVRRLDTDLVFPQWKSPQNVASIRSAWVRATNRAGLKDFRFHDLRHTCASYLAMNGATANEIAEILGHRTLTMVKRYAHLSEAHVSEVVERMNRKIFGS